MPSSKLRRLVVLGSLAMAMPVSAPAHGSATSQRFFFTQGPNGASCELDVAVARLPTVASCLVGPPKVSEPNAMRVELAPSGKMTLCRGLRCIGNAPAGTHTLAYGRSITLGPFRCTSLRSGVRCVVAKLGRGFLLGRRTFIRIS